jgi:hypothetical protein
MGLPGLMQTNMQNQIHKIVLTIYNTSHIVL